MHKPLRQMIGCAVVVIGSGLFMLGSLAADGQSRSTAQATQSRTVQVDDEKDEDRQSSPVAQPPATGQTTDRADDQRQEWMKRRQEALNDLAGTHELEIEIRPETDQSPFTVLVNGDPVDRRTASMFVRLIRSRADSDSFGGAPPFGDVRGPGAGGRDGEHEPRARFRGGGGGERRWVETELRRDPMGLEFIDTVLQVVKDFEPQMWGPLVKMQDDDDPRFEGQVRRFAFRLTEEVELKHSEPNAYALRLEDRQLEEQAKVIAFGLGMMQDATPEAIEEVREQLRTVYNRRFEIEMEMKGASLQRMSSRIQELIERLETERAKQSETVERRVDRVIEEIMANR